MDPDAAETFRERLEYGGRQEKPYRVEDRE
jgi:hypothetical protein